MGAYRIRLGGHHAGTRAGLARWPRGPRAARRGWRRSPPVAPRCRRRGASGGPRCWPCPEISICARAAGLRHPPRAGEGGARRGVLARVVIGADLARVLQRLAAGPPGDELQHEGRAVAADGRGGRVLLAAQAQGAEGAFAAGHEVVVALAGGAAPRDVGEVMPDAPGLRPSPIGPASHRGDGRRLRSPARARRQAAPARSCAMITSPLADQLSVSSMPRLTGSSASHNSCMGAPRPRSGSRHAPGASPKVPLPPSAESAPALTSASARSGSVAGAGPWQWRTRNIEGGGRGMAGGAPLVYRLRRGGRVSATAAPGPLHPAAASPAAAARRRSPLNPASPALRACGARPLCWRDECRRTDTRPARQRSPLRALANRPRRAEASPVWLPWLGEGLPATLPLPHIDPVATFPGADPGADPGASPFRSVVLPPALVLRPGHHAGHRPGHRPAARGAAGRAGRAAWAAGAGGTRWVRPGVRPGARPGVGPAGGAPVR